MSETKLSIGIEELKAMLSEVMQEARKPPLPTEAEQKTMAEAQEFRRQNAQMQKRMKTDAEAAHRVHTHMRQDGTCQGKYVSDDLGGYIICLGCQARIRPEIAMEHRKIDAGGIIYDTALFNRLFQASQPSTMG